MKWTELTVFVVGLQTVEAFTDFRVLPRPKDFGVYEEPVVHCFSDGQCIAAFEQYAFAQRILFTSLSTDKGATWAEPTKMFTNADSVHPKLTCIEEGQAQKKVCAMTWSRGNGNQVWVARSVDGGKTWTDKNVAPLQGPYKRCTSLPDVSCFSLGGGGSLEEKFNCVVLAFSDGSTDPLMLARSEDGGRTYNSPKAILQQQERNTVGVSARSVRVDCTNNGALCVAVFNGDEKKKSQNVQSFTFSRYPNQVVTTMRSTDGGKEWSAPATVEPSDKTMEKLDAAKGYRNAWVGNPVVRCLDQSKCVLATHMSLSGTDRWVETAWSADGGATWSKSRPLFESEKGSADEVALSCYGSSTCVLVWELDNDARQVPMFSVSKDAGKTWSKPDLFQDAPVKARVFDMYNDIDVHCTSAGYCVSIYEASGIDSAILDKPSIAVSFLDVNQYQGGGTYAPTSSPGGPTKDGNKDGEDDGSNIGLIVGLSVGGAALVGAGSYVAYKKFIANKAAASVSDVANKTDGEENA